MSSPRLAVAGSGQGQLHPIGPEGAPQHVQRLAGQPGGGVVEILGLCPFYLDLDDLLWTGHTGQQPLEQLPLSVPILDQVEHQPTGRTRQRLDQVPPRCAVTHQHAKQRGARPIEPGEHLRGVGPGQTAQCVLAIADVDDQPPPLRVRGVEALEGRLKTTGQIGASQAEFPVKPIQGRLGFRFAGGQPTVVKRSPGHVDAHQPKTVGRAKIVYHRSHCPTKQLAATHS